ncbi:hypothetical protein ISCGN_017508 [Ixodes scapularis]
MAKTTFVARELLYTIEDSQCTFLLTDQESAPNAAKVAMPSNIKAVFSVGNSPGFVNVLQFQELSDASFTPHAPANNEEELAAIIYTSGSVGPPKGVEISHKAYCAGFHAFRKLAHHERLQHSQQDRDILMLLPDPKLDLPPLQPDLPHWEDVADIENTRPLFRKRNLQTLARLTTAHEKMVGTWKDPLHTRLVTYTDAAADDGPAGPLCSAAVFVATLSISTSRERHPGPRSREGLEAVTLALESLLHEHTDIRLRELWVFKDSRDALTECKKAHNTSRKASALRNLFGAFFSRA